MRRREEMIQNSLSHRVVLKTFLQIVSIFTIVCLTGCNRSNISSPDQDNIWGFDNQKKEGPNTFHLNTATVADASAYTFVSAQDFFTLVQEAMHGQYQGVYQTAYQDEVMHQIEKIKGEKVYSIDHPLFISNPYGTNASGLYVYMGYEEQKVKVSYNIAVEDTTIPDFSGSMYINRTNTTDIEGQIIGLLCGQLNKVVIDVRDEQGGKLAQRAYLLATSSSSSKVLQNLVVEHAEKAEYTRGLFHFLVWQEDKSYYVFYDNNGVLRSLIPTNVSEKHAKVLPVDNHLLVGYRNNMFVLLNNLGKIESFYSLENGDQVIDYDYDDTMDMVLMVVKNLETKNADHIMGLSMAKGEWSLITDFTKLIKDYKKNFLAEEDEEKDWIDLKSIQCVGGKDYIVLSGALSSIIRVNNAYTSPVIRWVIGSEQLWQDTRFESDLLFQTGEISEIERLDSMTYQYSKKLKEGTFYINVIQRDMDGRNARFHQYLVDESQNRYRVIQTIPFTTANQDNSAITYGKHVVLRLGEQRQLLEYNEKGEIMIKMLISNMNSSYQIYKYTMDRYWF